MTLFGSTVTAIAEDQDRPSLSGKRARLKPALG